MFLFTTASRTTLGPTQPPIQWVPGALSLRIKRPGRREADHLHPSSAEVKECMELYLHSPNTPSWRGTQLKKAQGLIFLAFISTDSLQRYLVHITSVTLLSRFVIYFFCRLECACIAFALELLKIGSSCFLFTLAILSKFV
jgi:hypothetical protein